MVNIALFASGRGSNAQAIIEYLKGNVDVNVALIASNNSKAGVLLLAEEYHIPTLILDKSDFSKPGTRILKELSAHNIQLIVLAGFLKKIPDYLIKSYPDSILNIHPSLLPKFGGKGMYGKHVHQAVYDNREEETGITIHIVNEKYDDGKILFQASKEISPEDLPAKIAEKVLELEHFYYPRVIEAFAENTSFGEEV